MNCPYFACPTCKIYIDAGYRWAYWTLEDSGVVKRNEVVDVATVLALTGYWNPPEADRSEWLCEQILPAVRRFLTDHQSHGVIYTDEGAICNEDSQYFNWSEVETCDESESAPSNRSNPEVRDDQ